jgi:hypothetical protein
VPGARQNLLKSTQDGQKSAEIHFGGQFQKREPTEMGKNLLKSTVGGQFRTKGLLKWIIWGNLGQKFC